MICEALSSDACRQTNNIVVESDSQVVISSIKSQMDVLRLIINHVTDIRKLVKNFNNATFNFCTKNQNSFTDNIVKSVHNSCNFFIYQLIPS